MARKRYTRQQSTRLLERLIAVVEAQTYSEPKTRRILGALLDAPVGEVVVRGSAGMADVPTDDIGPWLHRVRDLIRGVVGMRDHRPGVVQVLCFTGVTLSGLPLGRDHGFEVTGPSGQLIYVQMTALLRAVGDALRECACGRIYVRTGKRRFCSTTCQKRVYMRMYRGSDTGEE